MRFRQFLEIGFPGKVTDPKGSGKKWAENIPEKTERINKSECRTIAGAMADPETNHTMVLQTLLNSVAAAEVYRRPIVGNVLSIDAAEIVTRFPQAAKLAEVEALILNARQVGETIFGFVRGGPAVGMLLLRVMPLVYSDLDKMALFGMIAHEVRHAYDFALGIMSETQPMPANFDDYVNRITEARAYGEQIITLIEEMLEVSDQLTYKDAIGLVETVLQKAGHTISQKTMPVARAYLRELKRRPGLFHRRKHEQVGVANRDLVMQQKAQQIVTILGEWLKLFDAATFLNEYARKTGVNPYTL